MEDQKCYFCWETHDHDPKCCEEAFGSERKQVCAECAKE